MISTNFEAQFKKKIILFIIFDVNDNQIWICDLEKDQSFIKLMIYT